MVRRSSAARLHLARTAEACQQSFAKMEVKQLVNKSLLQTAKMLGSRWPVRPRALVLMFHAVDRSGSPYSIAPEVFRAQMEVLLARGSRFVRARELAQALSTRQGLNQLVCVTFDDALESVAEPIQWLHERGGSASLFVVTTPFGFNQWDAGRPDIPRRNCLSWEALRSLATLGVEIGSHSVNHPRLSRLTPSRVDYELRNSREALQQKLAVAVDALAYPYGDFNRAVVAAARAIGYRCAFTIQPLYVSARTNLMLIPRHEPTSVAQLDELISGTTHLYYHALGLWHRTRSIYLSG
jgi:peptidoglycan/xylan/chitin deacetylase (PgdA/CDA1 family)